MAMGSMDASDAVERGRAAFARRAWGEACDQLSVADREAALGVEDLEMLAVATYLVGREGDSADAWERAHQAWLQAGGAPPAARCAFWLAFGFLNRGDLAQGGG